MEKIIRIAVLGDFNPIHKTHHALNDSIRHIQEEIGTKLQFDWIGTDIFDCSVAFNNLYSGLWIAPGSPYKNMDAVVNSITYARINNIPTLGNCGGFQHMIIEFARNVCKIKNADHEETNPQSTNLVISKLSCSLVAKEEHLTITDRQSILYTIIKQDIIRASYFCSYGINDQYKDLFAANGLCLTAMSNDGQIRAFELKNHPFFVGTLFQPALTSVSGYPNPILLAFSKQCIGI